MKETKIDLIAMQNENVPTNTMQNAHIKIKSKSWRTYERKAKLT